MRFTTGYLRFFPLLESSVFPTTKNRVAKRTMLTAAAAANQGLTPVHFSTQRKRFLWDRVCIKGLFRGCFGGVRGYWGCQGVFRVYYVSETAQVELKVDACRPLPRTGARRRAAPP